MINKKRSPSTLGEIDEDKMNIHQQQLYIPAMVSPTMANGKSGNNFSRKLLQFSFFSCRIIFFLLLHRRIIFVFIVHIISVFWPWVRASGREKAAQRKGKLSE
jgi:hypothetical protein